MSILQKTLRFVQKRYAVGEPSKNYFLLRCVDIVSPFMLLQRQRSWVEICFKVLWIVIMFCHTVGLVYDILRQPDIRAQVDIFCMLTLFTSVYSRTLCLQAFVPEIAELERLDGNPGFRVGTPYGDAIRRNVAYKNNLFLGFAMVMHFVTIIVYVWTNLTTPNSFMTIITYWPTDLASFSPTLDKLAQAAYCLTSIFWGFAHASGQVTIIVLLRMAIAEFRVFLHSLGTLNDQIERAHDAKPNASRERIVVDLLQEHARRHSELIVVIKRVRDILHSYMLIHILLYMAIVAAFMSRTIVITGSSTLGNAIPLLATSVLFFETLGLSLLVEQLIQLNRKVTFALYSFDWTTCLPFSRSIKRTMLLMMMQANNTSDFSAGGFTNISAELFAASCRAIYSVMMCMANLANAET